MLEKSCRGFAAPLYELMAWETELKYRMRGRFVSEGDDRLMLFDLEEPEMIKRELVETPVVVLPEVATTEGETAVLMEMETQETSETVLNLAEVSVPEIDIINKMKAKESLQWKSAAMEMKVFMLCRTMMKGGPSIAMKSTALKCSV